MKQALVVLEDGTFFTGEAFGYEGEVIGEVVFNTSMSGYQEILTDPSYSGQLVTMTTAHVGNYGVNELDVESDGVKVSGFIVREASLRASNYRATGTLDEYLKANKTVAITGVDTRALTRSIRDKGAIMGAIVHGATEEDVPALVEKIKAAPRYAEHDFVAACSVTEPKRLFLRPTGDRFVQWNVRLEPADSAWEPEQTSLPDVALVDYGVKHSILRYLALQGVRVTVYPHDTPAETLLESGAAGILLSNGPGDPGTMDDAVAQVQSLIGKKPLFGICLGHQLLSRAIGGETYKLKFGHRGPNQPVKEHETGRVQISSQNHGYAVSPESIEGKAQITYTNLNDKTVAGIEVKGENAFSVQFHPEAGPGPHDTLPIFEAFRRALV